MQGNARTTQVYLTVQIVNFFLQKYNLKQVQLHF